MSLFNSHGPLCSIISAMAVTKQKILFLTARSPPEPGKLSVSGSSSLDESKPCFSTHWRAASTRFPLLPLVPSFAAISALLPITIYGTGRPPGPPDPRGAENVPVAAISAAHFCKLVFVLLWERSWTKITPTQIFPSIWAEKQKISHTARCSRTPMTLEGNKIWKSTLKCKWGYLYHYLNIVRTLQMKIMVYINGPKQLPIRIIFSFFIPHPYLSQLKDWYIYNNSKKLESFINLPISSKGK